MKRKFFSLMVAACAALVSITSFTGCSGGVEGSEGKNMKGYLTYDGFTKQMRGIRLEAGAVYLQIKPTAPIDDYAPEDDDLPYEAGRRMYVQLSNDAGVFSYNSIATYEIESCQDENGIVLPYSPALAPYKAKMTVTLGSAAATTNSELLAALLFGGTHESLSLADNIVIELRFVGGNGGQAVFTSVGRYVSDSNVVRETALYGDGPFSVVR